MTMTVNKKKCPQNHKCPAIKVCPNEAILQKSIFSVMNCQGVKSTFPQIKGNIFMNDPIQRENTTPLL